MGDQAGKKYLFAWVALVAFTLLSFAGHYLPLGRLSTAVALAIAAVKAGIVLVVFMHLMREPVSVRTVAALNIAWVVLISAGIAVDVATQ